MCKENVTNVGDYPAEPITKIEVPKQKFEIGQKIYDNRTNSPYYIIGYTFEPHWRIPGYMITVVPAKEKEHAELVTERAIVKLPETDFVYLTPQQEELKQLLLEQASIRGSIINLTG